MHPDRLVLQRLHPVRMTRAAAHAFGESLARTHAAGAEAFGAPPPGRPAHGWIGRQAMTMVATPTWGRFYAEQRVLPFARAAARRGTARPTRPARRRAGGRPVAGRRSRRRPAAGPAARRPVGGQRRGHGVGRRAGRPGRARRSRPHRPGHAGRSSACPSCRRCWTPTPSSPGWTVAGATSSGCTSCTRCSCTPSATARATGRQQNGPPSSTPAEPTAGTTRTCCRASGGGATCGSP